MRLRLSLVICDFGFAICDFALPMGDWLRCTSPALAIENQQSKIENHLRIVFLDLNLSYSSPIVSSIPHIRFIACIIGPTAPLMRLSIADTTMSRFVPSGRCIPISQ